MIKLSKRKLTSQNDCTYQSKTKNKCVKTCSLLGLSNNFLHKKRHTSNDIGFFPSATFKPKLCLSFFPLRFDPLSHKLKLSITDLGLTMPHCQHKKATADAIL